MNKISVFLVDDHQLFREGLKLLLSKIPIIGEISEASNGKEFIDALDQYLPDIVFMDIEMPVMNGMEATRKALALYPEIKIVALSIYDDEEYYSNLIDAGIRGFILKNSSIKDIEDAINCIMSGKKYFSNEILSELVKGLIIKRKFSSGSILTDRESEILFYICKGNSNKEIAEKLSISKRTVDKHRENILLKTDSKNTAGLVMYAIRNGIAGPHT